MKFIWVYIVTFGIIGLGLLACQPISDKTVCEPSSSPFATPVINSIHDVRVAYAPNIAIDRVCTFSGQVTRAQVYKHEIVQGLVFCLRPNTVGWDIVISDTLDDDCGQGFNGIVTPPFHGENPIFIGGYQFRNNDNSAENDGSVNAPQKVREFNFLFSKKDYDAVWFAHSCIHWNHCENGMTIEDGAKIIATMPKSSGVMTITNLVLGNLTLNDIAWVESMEFEVKIYLSAGK